MKKELEVEPIKNGTVIDHIAGGQSPNVLKILGIIGGTNIKARIGINVPSKTMCEKDLVMIGDRELKSEEVDKIALIAPNATINIIRDSKVAKKHQVKLPETIEGIIKCANENCISNAKREPVISKFITKNGNPPEFRCFYCERTIKDVAKAILP